jgi:uncharacterized membrane protein YphA (DoxX/SURF4 family)
MEKATAGSSKTRAGAYWIATVLAALLFAAPGVGLLVGAPHFVQEMGRLGYPMYFLTFLGAWKVLGAVAILAPRFPRVKEWAYAGMIFDISGAVVSRLATGDEPIKVILPFVIAGIVVASWALRPDGRVLRSDGTSGTTNQQTRNPLREPPQRSRAVP